MAQIEVKEVPEITVKSKDVVTSRGNLVSEIEKYMEELKGSGIEVGEVIAIFHGKEDANYRVELAVPVSEGGKRLGPAVMATTVFRGDPGKVDNAYATILFWALKNGYNVGQPSREIFKKIERRDGEIEVEVEVQVPVEKRA